MPEGLRSGAHSGLQAGREAFDRQAWGRAYEELASAAAADQLEVGDLERLASAAYLLGRAEESYDVWARAHQRCARAGEPARAVRCAFWLAFALLNAGELARGGGWVDRARRLLDDAAPDCVERGYLAYLTGLRAVFGGDAAGGHAGFAAATDAGLRFGDPELVALAQIGAGRCLIYLGRVAEGVALLDEAMAGVAAGDISAVATGDAYCTVIDGCQELFDVDRAQVWTAALSRWCDSQPDLVLYHGQCLVHRAELMALHGDWAEAMAEARRACERLATPTSFRALGAATYLTAELHRLAGRNGPAEAAYRAAAEQGRDPQPGLALLRLAQGRLDVAEPAIRRSLEEAGDPAARARLLGPYVEIMVAADDVPAARDGAAELVAVAAELDRPYLRALGADATGVALLAAGEARAALLELRAAWAAWHGLGAPHPAARVRARIALACRQLGDRDSAAMELDAARSAFAALGAGPDLAWADRLAGPAGGDGGVLTARELEVLALVAKGMTNRQIATALVISEKTVATHVGHIFAKLDLPSRAAATAYAFSNGLA